jgi:Disulphide bond corrector protein DsbC
MPFSKTLVVASLFVICLPKLLNGQEQSGPGADSLRPRVLTENAEQVDTVPPEKIVLQNTGNPDAIPLGEIRASLIKNLADTEAIIRIEVLLAPGCHIYSLTQDDPRQTRIDVSQSPYVHIAGPAQPSRKPDPVSHDSTDPAESYSNEVAFIVPLKLDELPRAEDLTLLVRINGMVCSDKGFCLPIQDQVIRTVTRASADTLPIRNQAESATADSRDSGLTTDR